MLSELKIAKSGVYWRWDECKPLSYGILLEDDAFKSPTSWNNGISFRLCLTGGKNMELREDELFICDCYSDEHHFVFKIDLNNDPELPWHGKPELYLSAYLNQYRRLWKRIWTALRYVFRKPEKWGHWDVVIVKDRDILRLRSACDKHIELLRAWYEKNKDEMEPLDRNKLESIFAEFGNEEKRENS